MTLINLSHSQPQPSVSSPTGHTPATLLPSYASWYDPKEIHEIEKRALPEFFPSLSSTYVEYRQFMIDSSRSRPQEYLSVAMCRRALSGDVGGIYRVHCFLEQWGLINFQFKNSLQSAGKSGIVMPKAKTIPSAGPGLTDSEVPIHRRRFCVICKEECTLGMYCLASSKGVSTCPECFAEGRLAEGTSSSDYYFIETPLSALKGAINQVQEWTDEQELLLLEAIETHNNDWEKISAAVGRTKEQCIWKFLKLPISEGTPKGESLADAAHPSVSPFLNLENPVIGTVAFLASLVHPKVASAAAKAALQILSESPDSCTVTKANEAAAVTALTIASSKAALMVAEEEKVIQQLRDALVASQLKKVQLKMAYLEALEKNVLEEKAELEKQRMVLFLERVNLKKAIIGMEGRVVVKRESVGAMEGAELSVISDNTRQ